MIKTAQGPPHLSANNPFFLKKLLFFGLEQKTRKRKHFFSFSASSSSHLHSEQRGNFYSLFINLCNFFFFAFKEKSVFLFFSSWFFCRNVENWRVDLHVNCRKWLSCLFSIMGFSILLAERIGLRVSFVLMCEGCLWACGVLGMIGFPL